MPPDLQSPSDTSSSSRLPAFRAGSWYSFGLHALAHTVLFALIALAYTPSLGHGPRQDQWHLLIDTINQHDFGETFALTYSYPRTRVCQPGDYQLFRPVLYALLAAEKSLFGTNVALWQWTGIALHCLVVLLFLQILLQIHRILTAAPAAEEPTTGGWLSERHLLLGLAYGFALFFGLNAAIIEMVIWSHINGYLLFIVLALGALLLALKLLAEPNASPGRWMVLTIVAFVLVLVSAFTYEIGQFFAVMIGTSLALAALAAGRRGRAVGVFALFASVFVLYQGLNFLDRLAHPGEPDVTLKMVAEKAASTQTLKNASRYLVYTVVQPFLPSRLRWWYCGRVGIEERVLTWRSVRPRDPMRLASDCVLVGLFLLSLRGLARFVTTPGRGRKLLIVALPLSLFLLHAAATVLGRMNIRYNEEGFDVNSYYAYLPLLGVLIALYALCTSAVPGKMPRVRGLLLPIHAVLLLGLVVLGLFSGSRVHAINVKVKSDMWRNRFATRTLQRFIDEHQHEPGFSFAFDLSVYGESEYCHGIPLPVILFKRYLDNHHPRYLISMEKGVLIPRRYTAESQVFPDLVKIGTALELLLVRRLVLRRVREARVLLPRMAGFLFPDQGPDPSGSGRSGDDETGPAERALRGSFITTARKWPTSLKRQRRAHKPEAPAKG